jgi:hypothetical protein
MCGLGALAVCVIGAFFNPHQFFRSYLVAFVFWAGVALGSMAIAMLHHLTGGAWGLAIRGILESAFRTFPVLLLLFLPLIAGMTYLYEWAHEPIPAKAAYLNVPFFLARTGLYFAIWLGLAHFLNKWREPLRLQHLSGAGLLLYGGTVTFAAVDWVMSLEPHWFSTIFGILYMGGQGVSALCFVIAVAVILARRGTLAYTFHDLGNLLLAFIMLWAYFNLSQFLIIWSGNLPEEIPYYLKRWSYGWQWIGLALVVLHFALPFVLLLSRDRKRNPAALMRVAGLVVVMRLLDLYWQIAPTMPESKVGIPWMFVLAPLGVGGIWLAAFTAQLDRRMLAANERE